MEVQDAANIDAQPFESSSKTAEDATMVAATAGESDVQSSDDTNRVPKGSALDPELQAAKSAAAPIFVEFRPSPNGEKEETSNSSTNKATDGHNTEQILAAGMNQDSQKDHPETDYQSSSVGDKATENHRDTTDNSTSISEKLHASLRHESQDEAPVVVTAGTKCQKADSQSIGLEVASSKTASDCSPGNGKTENGQPRKGRWWQDSEFDFEQEAEEAEYETTGSEWIGRTVRRTFGKKVVSYGFIESWLPPSKNDGRAFYRVKHDDGDEEDLELDEVKAAVAAAETMPKMSVSSEHRRSNRGEEKLLLEDLKPPELPSALDASREMRAAFRGLEYAVSIVNEQVSSFGADGVQLLADVGHSSADPLRGLALYHLEQLAQRWKGSIQVPEDDEPGVYCDALCGLYGLERAGVGHPECKHEWREFYGRLQAKWGPDKARALVFGYDPITDDGLGPINLEKRGTQKTRYRALTWALEVGYYADRLGLGLGAGLIDVMRRLAPTRDRYSPVPAEDRDTWIDQMDLVVAVIMAASNFGELALRPSLLAKEYAIVVHPKAIAAAIDLRDVHLVAALCRCAKIFDHAQRDDLAQAVVARAVEFLLDAQASHDGSWPTRDDAQHPYAKFHAAALASAALADPCFRGFGPSSQRLKDVLTSTPFSEFNRATASYAASGPSLLLPNQMRTVAATCYDGSAATNDPDQDATTLEAIALRRLNGLLKWKAAVEAKRIDHYEALVASALPARSRDAHPRRRRRLR